LNETCGSNCDMRLWEEHKERLKLKASNLSWTKQQQRLIAEHTISYTGYGGVRASPMGGA
jgi:ABC-type phosphate transport system ATPase subunit